MIPIWKGMLSFGLVNMAIRVYPATKTNDIALHFLHKIDLGRINNQRVCKKCGAVVQYRDLVRGYEYEKDHYVALTEKDFEKANVEASKNVEILDFVDLGEIDPLYFDRPYYLVPEKPTQHIYTLLREALKRTKKVGIARVVLRDREHLAAVKPNDRVIVLELMRFADEIQSLAKFDLPKDKAPVAKRELGMAEQLINSMSNRFDPSRYKDTYRENLLKLIHQKVAGKEIKAKPIRKQPTNVIDIVSKLKASLQQTGAPRKAARKKTAA